MKSVCLELRTVFDDHRNPHDAVCGLDGKNGWQVEMSHNSRGGVGCCGSRHGHP